MLPCGDFPCSFFIFLCSLLLFSFFFLLLDFFSCSMLLFIIFLSVMFRFIIFCAPCFRIIICLLPPPLPISCLVPFSGTTPYSVSTMPRHMFIFCCVCFRMETLRKVVGCVLQCLGSASHWSLTWGSYWE